MGVKLKIVDVQSQDLSVGEMIRQTGYVPATGAVAIEGIVFDQATVIPVSE